MSPTPTAIEVIRGEIDATEAERLSTESVGEPAERGTARAIFYPYYWFSFRETVATFVGKSSVRISCLVDGRIGLPATSDPFDVAVRRADGNDVLPCAIAEHDAFDRGRRFVRHASGARRRALVGVRREVVARALVYKPFWVVSIARTPEPSSFVVDGVTGERWWVNRR